MPVNYECIPEELRWTTQWCIAGLDEKGTYKCPYSLSPHGLYKAKPNNDGAAQRIDFETALEFAEANAPHGLGFVISSSDPYVCIDLDIKNASNEPDSEKWTKQSDIERFYKIINAFGSYTERSAGGQGFHIWVKGYVGKGRRRSGVEVYSQERFIVCTGDVVLDSPIKESQELLNMLLAEMSKGEAPLLTLVDNEQIEGDEIIIARANNAGNGAKFVELCNGGWMAMGYPSQSEADAALFTILAFYTKSNSQVFRIFRMTELGKREKATRDDVYLMTTIRKVRSIEASEAANNVVGENIAQALIARLAAQPKPQLALVPAPQPTAPPVQPMAAAPATAASPPPPPPFGTLPPVPPPLPNHVPSSQALHGIPALGESLEYPPGFAGEIAKYIYATSPRPIKEVSVVATIGLLAGICGKAYSISDSGLNLYIILVGQSSIGKEAMHTGISNIVKIVCSSLPDAHKFVDFSDYVSAPALTKAIAANHSFVNVCGEFGRKLQRMGAENFGMDTGMQQLRTVMTNLYQKSGPGSIFGGLGYSDKEKNVASTSGVAYSMIGETTPGTFYDALTDSMMADGFLSRFTIVEYLGSRPPLNEQHKKVQMGTEMQELLVRIFGFSKHINDNNSGACDVGIDEPSSLFLHSFDKKCDREINGTQNEGWRQLWNRAHLKVFRIAALLAIADNYAVPIIRIQHATWAYDLIMRDIGIMIRRMDNGEVGSSDSTRENKLLALCKSYLMNPIAASYGVPELMHKEGVIPRKYFQISTQKVSCFATHKLGQVTSMDMTIRSLVDGGYLLEIAKAESVQKYAFHGKAYRILNLPMGKQESAQLSANMRA
jgi:hypothetical protein